MPDTVERKAVPRLRRVLVVEDEYYLADDLVSALSDQGIEVIGPVGTIADAIALIEPGRFDCALVDVNLHGDLAFPVADRLLDAGVPFVLATGYDKGALPERFGDLPRIEKPYDARRAVEALDAALRASGKADR